LKDIKISLINFLEKINFCLSKNLAENRFEALVGCQKESLDDHEPFLSGVESFMFEIRRLSPFRGGGNNL